MLDKEIRGAILALHAKGAGLRKIAKDLGLSRNSVKKVLKSGSAEPSGRERPASLDDHIEFIRLFYAQCNGNLVRVREKLEDELKGRGQELRASYQTLTRFCRKQGIGVEEKIPSVSIVTAPGEEMQHDTSPYKIIIGGKPVKRQCASLVLGYSRMLFIAFYPKFDRFHMKIFLTDAFKFMGGTCRRCVIDNTSIAIACGSGKMAQVAPEVEAFEKRFGFRFMAHELMHCNRKGKVERPFDYVENNFLVGRYFKDDADLNRQALEWVEKANRRRLRDFKADPIELFRMEKPYLTPLPLYIPEVYRIWRRGVDQQSCVSLDSLKYPVPASYIGKEVMVRETKDRVLVLDGSKEIAVHPKREKGSPQPPLPGLAPRRQRQVQMAEEGKLRALGEGMTRYLEELKAERGPRYFWSVKKLFRLLCQYKAEDLIASIAKAREHRLFDPNRIETILLQEIASRDYYLPLESVLEDYEKWPQYQQGSATPEPDLKAYAPQEPPEE